MPNDKMQERREQADLIIAKMMQAK